MCLWIFDCYSFFWIRRIESDCFSDVPVTCLYFDRALNIPNCFKSSITCSVSQHVYVLSRPFSKCGQYVDNSFCPSGSSGNAFVLLLQYNLCFVDGLTWQTPYHTHVELSSSIFCEIKMRRSQLIFQCLLF